jgi:hypothetical protein
MLISLMATSLSELTAEGSVQQRLLQCLQRGELSLVEEFKALNIRDASCSAYAPTPAGRVPSTESIASLLVLASMAFPLPKRALEEYAAWWHHARQSLSLVTQPIS